VTRHEVVGETAAAFVARHFGREGRAWLAAAPESLAAVARGWGLELGPPLSGGLLSLVHAVTLATGEPAVLKLSGPWARARDEATALLRWDGGPTPALLAFDEAASALLLERVLPGEPAAETEPDAVAALLRRLHVPAGGEAPALETVVEERLRTAAREGRANAKRLAWAHAATARLAESAPAPVLLHGDFDERNLLRCARRGLCAVDPLPALGDPAYDAATWVHANGARGRRARLDGIVAATGLDRERVRDWAAVAGVHG
jgi:streptomycin 6-kinase